MPLHRLPEPNGFGVFSLCSRFEGVVQVTHWPTKHLCKDRGKRHETGAGVLP